MAICSDVIFRVWAYRIKSTVLNPCMFSTEYFKKTTNLSYKLVVVAPLKVVDLPSHLAHL